MTRRPRPAVLAGIGILIGTVAAFLGIGGGVAIVPLLVLGFGVEPRKAVGTSLGIVMFVAAAGVSMELFVGTSTSGPAWWAVLLIAPASVVASRAITPLVKRLPTHALRRGFAVVLFVAAAKLFGLPPFGDGEGGWFEYRELGLTEVLVLPALGLAVGTISTLVGIGGGLLIVPSLGLMFHDLSWLECRATSLLVVVPTAMVGYLRHLGQGTADASLVRLLAPACAAGSVAGSLAVHAVDTSLFQRAFAVCLVLIGIKLLLTKSERTDRNL